MLLEAGCNLQALELSIAGKSDLLLYIETYCEKFVSRYMEYEVHYILEIFKKLLGIFLQIEQYRNVQKS